MLPVLLSLFLDMNQCHQCHCSNNREPSTRLPPAPSLSHSLPPLSASLRGARCCTYALNSCTDFYFHLGTVPLIPDSALYCHTHTHTRTIHTFKRPACYCNTCESLPPLFSVLICCNCKPCTERDTVEQQTPASLVRRPLQTFLQVHWAAEKSKSLSGLAWQEVQVQGWS